MSSSINVFQPDYFEKTQQAHTPYDLVRWIWDKPPAFNPGERSGYSNANFTLLAYIIEQTSGQSYGEFLKTQIFDPLNLEHPGHRGNPDSPTDRASSFVTVGARDLVPSRHHDYSVDTGYGDEIWPV